jgi:hypothetical protein
MKQIQTMFLSLLLSISVSQNNKPFLLKLSGDTVFPTSIKIDRHMSFVMCEEKRGKLKFNAHDLRGLKLDTAYFESGFVRLKKFRKKHYYFLKKVISGRLSLYEIVVRKKQFQFKTFGGDVLHLRWVYRAHDWFKPVTKTLYFYKREKETREEFSMKHKSKTSGCEGFREVYTKKDRKAFTTFEIVDLYNSICE